MKDKDSRLLTERYQLIKEGMSIWPTKKGDYNGKVYFEPVFPPEWTDQHHGLPYDHMDKMYAAYMNAAPGSPEADNAKTAYDDAMDGKGNPNYRPDLDMHLSNTNAIAVIKGLDPYLKHHGEKLNQITNIDHNAYSYTLPIDVFIAACKSYLANSVGVDEPSIPSHIEPRQMRRTADVVDFKTGARTPGEMKPKGPMMIHGGRQENYIKERVMQLLHIANEGKQHGAEAMSIS